MNAEKLNKEWRYASRKSKSLLQSNASQWKIFFMLEWPDYKDNPPLFWHSLMYVHKG